MTKTLDTLIEDMYNLLDQDTDHVVSEENVEWFGEAAKDLLRSRLAKRKERSGGLRFSNLGKKDRQLWYEWKMPENGEKMSSKTFLKFLYGDFYELILLFLAKEAGHSVEQEQQEIEVDGIKGHIDAIIDGVVVDVKSASSYSFDKFMSGKLYDDDAFGYIPQLSGYANVLTPGASAAFLVADKVNGNVGLMKVPYEVISGHQPAPRIEHLKKVMESDVEPERCYDPVPDGKSGNLKLNTNCSYCAFKEHCWRDANGGEGLKTYIYSNGPRFLVRVEKEPRVSAIEEF